MKRSISNILCPQSAKSFRDEDLTSTLQPPRRVSIVLIVMSLLELAKKNDADASILESEIAEKLIGQPRYERDDTIILKMRRQFEEKCVVPK